MLKLTFFVLCIKITTGYYEGLAGYNNFSSIGNSVKPEWPVPIHYKPQVQRRKPCSHRRTNAQAELWIPSFRALVTKPLDSNVLEPQALKHEKVENTPDESKVSEIVPSVQLSSNNDSITVSGTNPVNDSIILDRPNRRSNVDELEPQALKHEKVENTPDESNVSEIVPSVQLSSNNDSITVPGTNPVDDSIILDRPNRRSNVEESPNRYEQSLSEDYDCDMDLDTKDYFDSQDGIQKISKTSNAKPLVGVEQKVIEMLRDCINKKQKYIEDKLNQGEEVPISGSRRSMGDINTNVDYLKSVDDGDKRVATDKNEKTPDVELTDDTKNSDAPSLLNEEYETSITLHPGKLFNELQNPAKTTGIAKISPTRRMPADNSRICYACSTSTNPSCWEPNNKTTIKYCRPNQNCITKSFGVKNSLTILRDCATSCDATSIPGIEPKYKSCSVCYNDYCNSAVTNNYNLVIIFLISAIKCTF